ncbi:hypothetical protein LCGC14_1181170 [marine sediment metagenome]|uniref:Uncharacterized protein n=1 Tax=marine sediment metagenome TaxID=412755 RepID=A0A0F9LM64_9ZZZZ
MVSRAHALSRDELVRTLTAYSGITTADGAGDGTTLVDSNLIGKNDFITEKTILIMSGDAKGEDKGALSFNTVNGAITAQGTGFSAQIKAGTIYRILNISSIEIDVANMDAKIGTPTDPAGTTTLFAWMANLFAVSGQAQGLVYYGKVTTYTDPTHFKVSDLAGFGDAFFKDNYRAYVVRDNGGAGAAPQGEMQPVSDYVSSDGGFTHTAFTTPVAVDDEILLIHNRLAEVLDLLGDVGNASASTLGSIYAILGNPAQSFLAMIGYEGATALANKLTAARAALLDEITAARLAELDPANLPADIDTLLTRLSAARAGYLDELDFDLQGTLAVIAGYIDAEVAAILGDVGDASTSTLGSLYAILGNPAQSFLTMIGYEGATALANKLTAARAALLDQITAARMAELDPANIPADIDTLLTRLSAARAALLDEITAVRLAELDAANLPADIDTLLTRLSATRAGYLDELDFDLQGLLTAIAAYLDTEIAAILGLVDSAESVGPYSYLDAGGEQTVVEDTATTRRRIFVEFSNRNMTQTGKFIIYRKTDGTNYDIWATVPCTLGAGDDRAWDAELTTPQHWKLTYTEDVDETAARDIPWNVITQVIE